jgi:hypothetical protein
MDRCHWAAGITCDASARIYDSTIAGTLDLANTAAGVTQSRAQNITNDANNVYGPTSSDTFNIVNGDIQ